MQTENIIATPGPESGHPQRKRLALALSGCSGRAVLYIGLLEGFDELGIPVDMIAANSSATFVACAYAAGTLPQLKEKFFDMTGRKLFFDLFEPSFRGGLFSLEKIDAALHEIIPFEHLEDLHIPVSIVASDITNGESIQFRMGSIARAIRASSSHPGMFEPVMWGGKVLIDGGLFEIVPVEAARSMGPDVTVGVDLSYRRNLFRDMAINLKRGYNALTRPIGRLVSRVYHGDWETHGAWGTAQAQYEDHNIDEIKVPNMVSIIGRALDYAIEERKKGEHFNCDLMLEPDVEKYGKIDTDNFDALYQEGKRVAAEAAPRIRQLLGIEPKI